jgi:hypothetical protein
MVIVPARQATKAGGIHSLESIPGLHKRLKIRALSILYTSTSQEWSGEACRKLELCGRPHCVGIMALYAH